MDYGGRCDRLRARLGLPSRLPHQGRESRFDRVPSGRNSNWAATIDNPRTDILRLAYEAGLRGLQEQRQTLSEVRTVSGQGVTLGTAASGVLGGLALADGQWTFWAVVGVVGWVVAAGCALYILAPRDGWEFNMSSATLADWATHQQAGTAISIDRAYEEAAEYLDGYHNKNNELLLKMQCAQLAVLVGAAVSVVGWLIHIAIL